MGEQSRLAVILHADISGSTALVQTDERAAHKQMRDCFQRLSETIDAFSGATQEIRGDALVATFQRASDGVSAALEFQAKEQASRRSGLEIPEVRIGVSMGEVIVADQTITGLGVVLAQRIEQLAEPGGVALQGAAYETIPRRLPFEYESLGEMMLKGVEEPVRVYLVEMRPGAQVLTSNGMDGAALTNDGPGRDRPTVAVLPFDNMSGDPEQNYFAEGISEDITTELSRFSSLFVISRHSSFAYRERTQDIKQIAKELGVQYVLEGSVRKVGDRVRVTAQLIDAESGGHAWADRYDRELRDIFDIQDEITSTVSSTLAGQLQKIGTERAKKKRTGLTAYEYLLRGLDLHKSGNVTEESCKKAVEMFSKAVEVDPTLARGHAWLACSSSRLWPEGWNDAHLDGAIERVRLALSLDPNESEAHRIAGSCFLGKREYDKARYHIERALELNPNDAHIMVKAADYFTYTEETGRALELVQRAMRLNPHHPPWYWQYLGLAHYVAEQYDDAIEAFRKNSDAGLFDFAYLSACLVGKEQPELANEQVAEIFKLKPEADVNYFRRTYPYTVHKNSEVVERFISQLASTVLPG